MLFVLNLTNFHSFQGEVKRHFMFSSLQHWQSLWMLWRKLNNVSFYMFWITLATTYFATTFWRLSFLLGAERRKKLNLRIGFTLIVSRSGSFIFSSVVDQELSKLLSTFTVESVNPLKSSYTKALGPATILRYLKEIHFQSWKMQNIEMPNFYITNPITKVYKCYRFIHHFLL